MGAASGSGSIYFGPFDVTKQVRIDEEIPKLSLSPTFLPAAAHSLAKIPPKEGKLS